MQILLWNWNMIRLSYKVTAVGSDLTWQIVQWETAYENEIQEHLDALDELSLNKLKWETKQK